MYVAVVERFGGRPVVIRTSEAIADVNAPFLRTRRWVIGAGLFTVAVGVGLGLWMARRLATPIREMQAMAGAVARGERGARLRSTRRDELGELARSLDHLAEELEARVEAMSRDRERALAMLSGMAEGIVALDGAGRVTSVNRAAEELFGVRGEDALGLRLAEAIRAAELLDLAEEVLHDRTSSEREARLGERVLQLTGSPMGGPSGGAVLLAHDITEVRRLEEVRRDFVANFSHEIRTPLSSILGYVETLLHAAPEDPAQRDDFLQKIQKNAHRLRELASDVLTLSRVEARPDLTDRSSVDVGEVATLSLEAWSERAQQKGLRLETEMDHGPFLVLGDRGLLLTALDNLLQNAITYTPAGGRVALSVRRQGDRVRVAVSDTGVGIPSAYLPRIFERFFRVDRGRSREAGGTGLGLAIVKHVALNHGGSVVATSEEGRGTEVALELPVADRGLGRVA
jgi:two-component system phosphate regulon sensor histidine kinase PhoR